MTSPPFGPATAARPQRQDDSPREGTGQMLSQRSGRAGHFTVVSFSLAAVVLAVTGADASCTERVPEPVRTDRFVAAGGVAGGGQ